MSSGSFTAISKHYSQAGKSIQCTKSLIKAKCIFSYKGGMGGAQEHKGENGNNLQGKHPHTPVLLQNSEQSVHSLKPLVV